MSRRTQSALNPLQAFAETAILFFAFWALMTFAILLLSLIFDGLDYLLHFIAQNAGSNLRIGLLVLAFSAMLAAAITATYVADAHRSFSG